jgi:hypothetical protein
LVLRAEGVDNLLSHAPADLWPYFFEKLLLQKRRLDDLLFRASLYS